MPHLSVTAVTVTPLVFYVSCFSKSLSRLQGLSVLTHWFLPGLSHMPIQTVSLALAKQLTATLGRPGKMKLGFGWWDFYLQLEENPHWPVVALNTKCQEGLPLGFLPCDSSKLEVFSSLGPFLLLGGFFFLLSL